MIQQARRRSLSVALVVGAALQGHCRNIEACGPGIAPCDADGRGGISAGAGRLWEGGAAGSNAGSGGIKTCMPLGSGGSDGGRAPSGGGEGGAPPRDAAGGQAAGALTAGGVPGAGTGVGGEAGLECSFPRANCDGTHLNGCETDLDTSPLHCGACRNRCHGTCIDGHCYVFEIMQANRIEPQGGIVFRGDSVYYYASSRETPDEHRLERLQYDEDGPVGVTVLAYDVWRDLHQLSASATRLYAREHEIWSVPLEGGEVRREGLTTWSMAVLGTMLAWVFYEPISGREQVYVRHTEDVTAAYEFVGEFAQAKVVATKQSIVIAFTTEEGRYGIARLNVPPANTGPVFLSEPLASGEGSVVRLWSYEDTVYYALEGTTETVPLHVARMQDNPQKIVLDAIDPSAQHAVHKDILLSRFRRVYTDGVHFQAFYEPGYAGDWLTLRAPELLTIQSIPSGDYLWFFDAEQRALVRTPLHSLLRASIDR